MTKYKTETYGYTFRSPKKPAEKLQADAEKKAQEGWTLHSWKMFGPSADGIIALYYCEEDKV